MGSRFRIWGFTALVVAIGLAGLWIVTPRVAAPGLDQVSATLRSGTLQFETGTRLLSRQVRDVAAVAARDSLASTLVAATERLAHDLDGQQCSARALTADELAEVDAAVLAGLEPTWSRPGWRSLKHFNGFATSFWVTPSDISTETLDEVLRPETDAAVLTIRLVTRGGRPYLSSWVRYHSEDRLFKDVFAGLNRLTGRQLAAIRASLPVPTIQPLLTVPGRRLHDDEKLVLSVASGASPASGASGATGASGASGASSASEAPVAPVAPVVANDSGAPAPEGTAAPSVTL